MPPTAGSPRPSFRRQKRGEAGVAVEFLMGDRWQQGEAQGRDIEARETARPNLRLPRSSPSEIADSSWTFVRPNGTSNSAAFIE